MPRAEMPRMEFEVHGAGKVDRLTFQQTRLGSSHSLNFPGHSRASRAAQHPATLCLPSQGDAQHCVLKASAPDPANPGAKPRKWELKIPAADHITAMQGIMDFISEQVSGSFAAEVTAVGHRIVHGLDTSAPVLLDERSTAKIRAAATFAPLHNPAGLQGIEAAQRVFGPAVPQVGWGWGHGVRGWRCGRELGMCVGWRWCGTGHEMACGGGLAGQG